MTDRTCCDGRPTARGIGLLTRASSDDELADILRARVLERKLHLRRILHA